MQVGLAVARSHRNSRILPQHKVPRYIEPTTLQAFNLATIKGARAIHMEDKIGSIKEGKQADLIIFNTDSPSMTCAVDHDPMVAVVRHATNYEIDGVMVARQFLKENGKLVDAIVSAADDWEGCETVHEAAVEGHIAWPVVAQQLRRSRGEIQHRIDGCNIEAAQKKIIEL